MTQCSFEKKLLKEEGRISELYLYINFSKLSWYYYITTPSKAING